MRAVGKMGPAEWAMLVLLSVVWGGAFFFYKLLDDAGLPPFTIVLGRVGVAALALLPVVALSGRRLPRSRRIWGALFVLGGLNNVLPFALIIFGEKHIDSGLASVFNATTPIFTALIAQFATRDEKLTQARVAGIVLGVVGVVLLMGPTVLRGFSFTSVAQLACVGAAVVYGFGAVYARRFAALGVDPLVLSAGQLCASALIALPLALALEHPWTALPALSAPTWLAWLGLALPSTALAFVLYFRILATAGATNAASVTFLVPVSAVLLGTLVLHERLAPSTLAGMLVIFLGLAVLDGRIIAFVQRRTARTASSSLIAVLLALAVARAAGAQTPAPALSPSPSPSASASVSPAPTGPCRMPLAVALADRPGTGRTTSSGGSPCVVPPGEIVIESGLRRQITSGQPGSSVLASGPLTFVRAGIAPRLEIGIAPPAPQSRAVTGVAPVDSARGVTDTVVALKYLVRDRAALQASIGAAYSPPTGTGEFTAGAPSYSLAANVGVAVTPALSFATSLVAGTAVGADASGLNRSYFVFAPSFTLGIALDANDTLLVQDALVSRQGPLLPAGSRAVVALQRAIGTRLAVDLDYERNLTPLLGTRASAVGFGFVWIATPARDR
ncbi:MAG TPA: DMT family transporter [Candidatus Elarobacter sp.]